MCSMRAPDTDGSTFESLPQSLLKSPVLRIFSLLALVMVVFVLLLVPYLSLSEADMRRGDEAKKHDVYNGSLAAMRLMRRRRRWRGRLRSRCSGRSCWRSCARRTAF